MPYVSCCEWAKKLLLMHDPEFKTQNRNAESNHECWRKYIECMYPHLITCAITYTPLMQLPDICDSEERKIYLRQAVLQLSAGKLIGLGGGGAGGAYSFSWKVYWVLFLASLALKVSRWKLTSSPKVEEVRSGERRRRGTGTAIVVVDDWEGMLSIMWSWLVLSFD